MPRRVPLRFTICSLLNRLDALPDRYDCDLYVTNRSGRYDLQFDVWNLPLAVVGGERACLNIVPATRLPGTYPIRAAVTRYYEHTLLNYVITVKITFRFMVGVDRCCVLPDTTFTC